MPTSVFVQALFLAFLAIEHLDHGAQTQMYRRATFQRKKCSAGRSLMGKILMRATNYKKALKIG